MSYRRLYRGVGRTPSETVICGGVASSADSGRYSTDHEQHTYDDQPAMTGSYYHCGHACDSYQKAERDPEQGVCLNRVNQSNREAAEHS